MLKLRDLLKQLGLSMTQAARALDISRPALSALCNHGHWPARDADALKAKIEQFLKESGATVAAVATAFEAKGDEPATLSEEDEQMLLRFKQLSPEARQHFGLARSPFDDVRNPDEVFMNRDFRHVRETIRHTARHGGFVAVVGESGAGKTTLREDFHEWVKSQEHPIIIIEMSSVREMEDSNEKGKTVKAAQIAEAIMATLAPGTPLKRGVEARQRQTEKALMESHRGGNRHVFLVEEAHSLPIPTLKHLKRFYEMKDGFSKLLGIVLIGQTELEHKLDEHNPRVREVVQRCQLIKLHPLDNDLQDYLTHRFSMAGKALNEVMDEAAVEALRSKLSGKNWSMLYPLAVQNVLTAALNQAAAIGMPTLTAELIAGV